MRIPRWMTAAMVASCLGVAGAMGWSWIRLPAHRADQFVGHMEAGEWERAAAMLSTAEGREALMHLRTCRYKSARAVFTPVDRGFAETLLGRQVFRFDLVHRPVLKIERGTVLDLSFDEVIFAFGGVELVR